MPSHNTSHCFQNNIKLPPQRLLWLNEAMNLSGSPDNFFLLANKKLSRRRYGQLYLLQNCCRPDLGPLKKMCYQPNLVSHQFGVSQTMPKPFYNRKIELCLCIVDYSGNEYLQRLAKHVNGRVILIPFSFQQPSIAPKNSTLGGEPTKQKNFLKSKHYLNI